MLQYGKINADIDVEVPCGALPAGAKDYTVYLLLLRSPMLYLSALVHGRFAKRRIYLRCGTGGYHEPHVISQDNAYARVPTSRTKGSDLPVMPV